MLKSCKHCGRIHDGKYDCGHKLKRTKQANDKNRFRWSRKWKTKSMAIKKRDLFMCQICARNLYGTLNKYNSECLEVHHAVSLEEDYERRLDDDNLITLCERHHKMAERKKIPLDIILGVIRQQTEEDTPPG